MFILLLRKLIPPQGNLRDTGVRNDSCSGCHRPFALLIFPVGLGTSPQPTWLPEPISPGAAVNMVGVHGAVTDLTSLRAALHSSRSTAPWDTNTLPSIAEGSTSAWDFWDDLQQNGQSYRKHMPGSRRSQLKNKLLTRGGIPRSVALPLSWDPASLPFYSGTSVRGERAFTGGPWGVLSGWAPGQTAPDTQ